MLIKRIFVFLLALAACGAALAADDVQIRTTRSDATVTIDRSMGEGKALVTVVDSKKAPVPSLTASDFAVSRGGETGRVLSVEKVDKTVDVPRHAVLVLDNSYSIQERKMIAPQLAEAGAVIKTLRPIDDGQMVILVDGRTVKMGDRNVHVDVFKSSQPSALQDYANKAYVKRAVTDNTYLYEEMYAGIQLLKAMPATEPRCLWVFTDGEDLNSAFKMDVVSQAAQGIDNLCVFVIDSMPGATVDANLAKFAEQTKGQARKAGKGSDLLAAFQKMGSRTTYQYAVSYEFPPPQVASAPAPAPKPAPAPPSEKTILFGAVLFDFDKAVLKPEGKEAIKTYREEARAKLSRADKVIITGHTDNKGTAAYNKKLSLRRANSVRDYLVSLGVDAKKLVVRGEGLTKPVADNKTEEGRAQNRRVEIELVGAGPA